MPPSDTRRCSAAGKEPHGLAGPWVSDELCPRVSECWRPHLMLPCAQLSVSAQLTWLSMVITLEITESLADLFISGSNPGVDIAMR